MKLRILLLAGLLLLLYSCNKEDVVIIPALGPNSLLKDTYPLDSARKQVMNGVYRVVSSTSMFGDYVVVKWNRTSLSFACNNGKHFIMEAGHLDSVVFLEGYWRDGYSDGTGLCSMHITKPEGGTTLVTGQGAQQIVIRGAFGNGNSLPDQALSLEYVRPFPEKLNAKKFLILAHRAGGRTSDLLPVSENSIEMIDFTEKLGSTGIEIDVRLSRINFRGDGECWVDREKLEGHFEHFTDGRRPSDYLDKRPHVYCFSLRPG